MGGFSLPAQEQEGRSALGSELGSDVLSYLEGGANPSEPGAVLARSEFRRKRSTRSNPA